MSEPRKFIHNFCQISGLYSAHLTSILAHYLVYFFSPGRRKSKVRRRKSRYKMLEADEQDSLELQPPRAGKILVE